jgi:hypothetical protein
MHTAVVVVQDTCSIQYAFSVCLGDDNEYKLRTKGTGKSSITSYYNQIAICPHTRYHMSNTFRLMLSHHHGDKYKGDFVM